MKIISLSSSVHRIKSGGTSVNYYFQEEYEIHYSKIPPHTIQEWHFHKIVEEVILIINGQLEIRSLSGKIVRKSTVKKGDLIRVENTPHTFANTSKKEAIFVVFKTMLKGKNNSKTFKNDKVYINVDNNTYEPR